MQAKNGKLIIGKSHCDRCQRARAPIHECSFSFREGYPHWKALWQARTGKRLTNRRKARLLEREDDQLDLKALNAITYWMDLCEACFQDCSIEVRDQFPQETWEHLLKSPSAEKFVPGKISEGPSAVSVTSMGDNQ